MSHSKRRVLILGLDGATFDLLDPLMEAGELPFLRSLVRGGLRAPLDSVYPPKTIPAWYSFATGLDPGTLGIFGFTEPDGGPGKSRIIQTFRPAEAVWDMLSRYGRTVGVINFPLRAGYPINGFVVPGMLTENPPTYPLDLRKSLEGALGEPYLPELPAYRVSERTHWMELATRGVDQRGRAGEFLIDRYKPDFLFALFRETDRVQHQHWAELARPPHQIGKDLRGFWRTVDRACERIDRAFRAQGGSPVTLIVSDHGHGPAQADFFTNRWLADEGFLVFKQADGTRRRRVLSPMLIASDRFPPTRWLVARVADRLRGGRWGDWFTKTFAGEASFESMADKIDWQRTVAFSYPVPEGIYLNRYNPGLTAERGATVVDQLKTRLTAYREANIEVLDPKEIYAGRHLENAPAVLLKIDGLATEPRMDFSYPRPMLRQRPGYFYGTGVHRMSGILIAAGDGVPARADGPGLTLLDLAPTILESMGVPVPGSMTGRSFADRLGGEPAS